MWYSRTPRLSNLSPLWITSFVDNTCRSLGVFGKYGDVSPSLFKWAVARVGELVCPELSTGRLTQEHDVRGPVPHSLMEISLLSTLIDSMFQGGALWKPCIDAGLEELMLSCRSGPASVCDLLTTAEGSSAIYNRGDTARVHFVVGLLWSCCEATVYRGLPGSTVVFSHSESIQQKYIVLGYSPDTDGALEAVAKSDLPLDEQEMDTVPVDAVWTDESSDVSSLRPALEAILKIGPQKLRDVLTHILTYVTIGNSQSVSSGIVLQLLQYMSTKIAISSVLAAKSSRCDAAQLEDKCSTEESATEMLSAIWPIALEQIVCNNMSQNKLLSYAPKPDAKSLFSNLEELRYLAMPAANPGNFSFFRG